MLIFSFQIENNFNNSFSFILFYKIKIFYFFETIVYSNSLTVYDKFKYKVQIRI